MIKLNKDYEFERDTYGWQLHHWHDSKTKDGKDTRIKKTTYHSNLGQVCGEMVDKEAGNCESVKEIISLLKDMRKMLENDSLEDKLMEIEK